MAEAKGFSAFLASKPQNLMLRVFFVRGFVSTVDFIVSRQ